MEYAGLIRKSGTHLLGLVNDLLDLSKIEAGRYELEMEEFDVRAVVEEVVRLSSDAPRRSRSRLACVTPQRAARCARRRSRGEAHADQHGGQRA